MSNLTGIKKEFPIFKQKVHGKNLVYLDSAATSQKPAVVIESMNKFYEEYNANIHRSIHALGERATAAYEDSRKKIADFINASPEEVIFTRGTTESLNTVARMLEGRINSGDEILLTEMEHHSNIVPWQQLAKRKNAKLRYVEVSEESELSEPKITGKTKIFSFTHTSNVLGTINDARRLTKTAHEKGALVVIDAAQAAAHKKIDVKKIDCDFLAFSGHKMFGPTGIGVLYAKRELLESLEPVSFGGDMIKEVTFSSAKWNDLPWKFEAGTPNISGAIGLGAAVDFVKKIGFDSVHEHELALTKYCLEKLSELRDVKIYGPKEAARRGPVVSFSFANVHAHDVAQVLDYEGVAIRAGHMCCQPLINKFGQSSLCRASFSVYNTKEDVDALVDGLKKVREVFR